MKYLLALICLMAIGNFFPAHATIDITPQKIVIDARERGGEFTVLNLFDKNGTFRIELLNYEQEENGSYKKLKSPLNPNFNPEEIVRFSPRQFTLKPGQRQKVRLSLRKPADLPEGEYRFHAKALRFATEEEKREGAKNNSVSLLMNTAIVIPVVVKHGNTQVQTKLDNATLIDPSQSPKERPELHIDVLRDGTASAIGKLDVYWQPTAGKTKKVGTIVNANVFTEINKRTFKIPLSETLIGQGTVTVRYTDEVNKGKILDEITIKR